MSRRIFEGGELIVGTVAYPLASGGPRLSFLTVRDTAELTNDEVRELRRALTRWLALDRIQRERAASARLEEDR